MPQPNIRAQLPPVQAVFSLWMMRAILISCCALADLSIFCMASRRHLCYNVLMEIIQKGFGKLLIASLAGFTLTFFIFTAMLRLLTKSSGGAFFSVPQAALIAGPKLAGSVQYQDSATALLDSSNGITPTLTAITSYLWWTGVIIGGSIASWLILQIIKRYSLEAQLSYAPSVSEQILADTGGVAFVESPFMAQQRAALHSESNSY